MRPLRSLLAASCSIKPKSESRSAFHQNQNYFPLSLMTTFAFVNETISMARLRLEC
jgi:hypothetical protein